MYQALQPEQRHIQNPAKHLWWSFYEKIVIFSSLWEFTYLLLSKIPMFINIYLDAWLYYIWLYTKILLVPSIGVLIKRCFENMQINLPENTHALQLYWNHTLVWVFSYKFAAYSQNIFSWEYIWRAASILPTNHILCCLWWLVGKYHQIISVLIY